MTFNTAKATVKIAVAALLFGLVGCESKAPMSPAADAKITKKAGELKILRSNQPRLFKAFRNQKRITVADGGKIVVGNFLHGKSKLIFQPGDVSRDVDVTFSWESTGFLEGGAEFSPHGIRFNHPVRIVLSYKDVDLTGVNEDSLRIWYYNENTGMWEMIGDEVNKYKKKVKGWIEHFSRYAIGSE